MTDKYAPVAAQLAALLGAENVAPGEHGIVVWPAGGEEIAGVMDLARQAGMTARAAGYTVGPAAGDGRADILISLERMNQVRLDRERQTIIARPAAEVRQVIDAARESGYLFPGEHCRHNQATVGENVAACFNEGEPDFKCADACLSGLELVLADGSMVTLGERSPGELDNYQLTYVMGGYREEQAVLSGIHLKLLPHRHQSYWLVAACRDMNVLPGMVAALLQKYRNHLAAVAAVEMAAHYPLAGMLGRWFPEPGPAGHPPGVALLVQLNGPPGELEALEELLNHEAGGGVAGISIAGDTYQKLALATLYHNLLAGLEGNPGLSLVATDDQREIVTRRLSALYWLKEKGMLNLFYDR